MEPSKQQRKDVVLQSTVRIPQLEKYFSVFFLQFKKETLGSIPDLFIHFSWFMRFHSFRRISAIFAELQQQDYS